jgi:hypothetical protein
VSDNAKEAKACLQAMIEEAGGFLPLDRFMEEALYHPRYGYYSASITQVGPEGGFFHSRDHQPPAGSIDRPLGLRAAARI